MATPEAFHETKQFERLYDAEVQPRDAGVELLATDLVLDGLRHANMAWAAANTAKQYDEIAARKAYNVGEACLAVLSDRAPKHVGGEWKAA